MIFEMYEDPGHAYLKVPLSVLAASGVEDKISGYSGKDNEFAYLEEDCDAPAFIAAYQEKTGEHVDLNCIWCEHRRVPTHNFRR